MNNGAHIVCGCSEIIVKSQGGAVKLRSKILIFKNNQAYAICKKCSSEVPVPVTLSKSLPDPQAHPRLYIRT